MNITELIAECEKLDAEASKGPWNPRWFSTLIRFARKNSGYWEDIEEQAPYLQYPTDEEESGILIARSRTLLPLLVAVIKNQQRQITCARVGLRLFSNHMKGDISRSALVALSSMSELAAELEDVKP